MGDPRDIELRSAALEHVRELQRRYDDLVPVRPLAEGFQFRGRRVSFGSFYSGIFRPKELEGPAQPSWRSCQSTLKRSFVVAGIDGMTSRL